MTETTKKLHGFKEFLLKKEFSLRLGISDLIYAFLCFFMSSCTLYQNRTPLALSVYAACFSKKKLVPFFAIVSMGLIRFRTDFTVIAYVFALFIATIALQMNSKKIKFRCVTIGLALFVVLFLRNVLTGFSFKTFLLDFLESSLCCGGTYLFFKAVPLSINAEERTYIPDGETICLFAVWALIIKCIASFPLLFGLDVSVVIAIVTLLTLNLHGQLVSGAAAGIALGIVTYGTGTSVTGSMGAFAFCSVAAGLLKHYGKWGVALGFVGANTVITVMFSGEVLPFDIFEVVASVVIFGLLPKTVTDYIRMFSGKTVHMATDGYIQRDKLQAVLAQRLDRLSASYENLSASYDKCFEIKSVSKEYLIRLIDSACARVCPGCGLKYNCWERSCKESYKHMLEMFEIAEEKGEIKLSDIPEAFEKKCIKTEEFISSFNRMYELYKVEKLWQQRLNESRMLVSGQLHGVSKSLKRLSEDFDMCLDVIAEKELKTRLDSHGIEFEDIVFLKGSRENFSVEILFKDGTPDAFCEDTICMDLKEVTGCNAYKADQKYTEKGVVAIFRPATEYILSYGNATAVKSGEEISGDSFIMCENTYGEFVACLSDGMGTGAKAGAESANATELLKNFMTSGTDIDTALELINSALLLRSSGESFATMDVCVTNLSMGKISFYKSGAAPGYIKNEHGVTVINGDSLPFGILPDGSGIAGEEYEIGEYAIAVLVSDGLRDIFQTHAGDGLIELIEKTNTLNPQILASTLIKEAMELCNKKANDDMTVLAVSVTKPKKRAI